MTKTIRTEDIEANKGWPLATPTASIKYYFLISHIWQGNYLYCIYKARKHMRKTTTTNEMHSRIVL